MGVFVCVGWIIKCVWKRVKRVRRRQKKTFSFIGWKKVVAAVAIVVVVVVVVVIPSFHLSRDMETISLEWNAFFALKYLKTKELKDISIWAGVGENFFFKGHSNNNWHFRAVVANLFWLATSLLSYKIIWLLP